MIGVLYNKRVIIIKRGIFCEYIMILYLGFQVMTMSGKNKVSAHNETNMDENYGRKLWRN